MRTTVVRDFFTGLTALVGLVGLFIMLILFGEFSDFGQKHYVFTVNLSTAAGLSATSPVTLNGVRVGQIESTAIRMSPDVGATLRVRVREGTKIPRKATVAIERSLVGDASLDFVVPVNLVPDGFIVEGEVVDAGEPSSLINRLTSMVEKPLERLTATADNIDKLAATYTTFGERLNEMIEPRTVAEVDGGKEPNLRTTIARADQALAGASKWLGDDALLAQSRTLIERANQVLTDVSALAGNLEQKTTKAGAQIDAVAAQALVTLRNTETAAGELAQALETVNKGGGTLGKLVNNPDLYNSLNDAAKRLDRALSEFQLLVEKYKTEGLPLKL